MITIGLTGGIAAGKSTVAKRWMELGGTETALIDTDQLAHQALMPDTPTWEEVLRTFGHEVMQPDRTINRRKLGDWVFADEQKRQALNHIIHPAVHQIWTTRLETLDGDNRTRQAIVVIPLLYEVRAEGQFDYVIVTACSETTQLSRLMARGHSPAQARARIRSQWPMPLKMDRADFVIWNDGSEAVLLQQTDIVYQTIKETRHAASQEQH